MVSYCSPNGKWKLEIGPVFWDDEYDGACSHAHKHVCGCNKRYSHNPELFEKMETP